MSAPSKAIHQPWPGLIAAYRDRLPVEDDWTPITLREGGTRWYPHRGCPNTPAALCI